MWVGRVSVVVYLLSLNGGAGKNALKYSNILAVAGYNVTLVFGTEGQLQEPPHEGVKLVRLGVSRTWRAIVPLMRLLRNEAPDGCLVVGGANAVPLLLGLVLGGTRCRVLLRETNSPMGLLSSYSSGAAFVKRLLWRLVYWRVGHIIALTSAMKEDLCRNWGVEPSKVSVVPNGVPVVDMVPSREYRVDPPVVLCVARLTPQKDVETLLRAISIVTRDVRVKVKVAGDGPKMGDLTALRDELGLRGTVEFLGSVQDVGELYRQASVVVLTSRYEGFPNVLIEALAYGVPVVSTDCPTGPGEIITDENVGGLVEVGNPESVAEGIQRVLSSRFTKADLISKAEEFSEERLQKRVLAIVESQLCKSRT